MPEGPKMWSADIIPLADDHVAAEKIVSDTLELLRDARDDGWGRVALQSLQVLLGRTNLIECILEDFVRKAEDVRRARGRLQVRGPFQILNRCAVQDEFLECDA